MGTTVLEEKYPFLMKYFKSGIADSDRNISHCILFYGTDLEAQYELAMEIARLLNCTGDHSNECNCLNCNWIRQNQHPAVVTVNKPDKKDSEDSSGTPVTISIEQARNIRDSLAMTSEYHRVFIFCDKDEDGNICGLNRINFQEEAANALLKTFEEPPKRTTFFFLTKDKDNMISTIISRSQCFFVPSKKAEARDYSLVQEVMENYFQLQRNSVLDFYDKLSALAKEHELKEILTQMQNYICELLKMSSDNSMLRIKLIKDINAIEHSIEEMNLNMKTPNILETLAYALILDN